jgi:shikimate kinase
MNIFLIGYRCSGKTSVGKSLAQSLGLSFIDADEELVKRQGLPIDEIVKKKGWGVFREIETAVINQMSALDGHVIATGGGSVLNQENVKNMKESGVLVWLKATHDVIKERMLQDKNTKHFRPSLTSKGLDEEIQETLSTRNTYYEKAMDFYVDNNRVGINDVCNAIKDKLRDVNITVRLK